MWKLLNWEAVDWLRVLLVMIEDHDAPWPADTLTARAAFIRKPGSDEHDPMSFRILSILAILYCTWAKTRLSDLRPWIRAWATDDMFSAVEGYGASDAAYHGALEVEDAMLMHVPFAGAKIDLWKAFDRLDRELVIAIALVSGLPVRIGRAYLRFMSQLKYRNTLAVGLGSSITASCPYPKDAPSPLRF